MAENRIKAFLDQWREKIKPAPPSAGTDTDGPDTGTDTPPEIPNAGIDTDGPDTGTDTPALPGAPRRFRKRAAAFFREHRGALIVTAFLLILRLLALYALEPGYHISSDDLSYIKSGIYLVQHGTLTMHEEYPSAQVMPGMTVLAALFYLLFGDGDPLWLSLKLFWLAMGTLTAWVVYRSVRLFAPKWCGVLAMLPFFRVDFIWADNLILTETPFHLALAAMVYYTLRMGRDGRWTDFWGCLISYFAGLMLKANIAPYPAFALIYLLFARYDWKKLIQQCVVVACVLACFFVPWTIRNYRQFHALIPLTYGAGNPALLGTYQGIGFPTDDTLDYENNVGLVIWERYLPYCYDENGELLPRFQRYISLRMDAEQAAYRQRVWRERDLGSWLYSYFFIKPQILVNGYFYWEQVFGEGWELLSYFHRLDLYFCIFTIAAALVLKRKRLPVLFLAGVYLFNVYVYAMNYAFERYNASLMCLRFVLIGIGLSLGVQLARKCAASVQSFEEADVSPKEA